jgi:hypothetical protein
MGVAGIDQLLADNVLSQEGTPSLPTGRAGNQAKPWLRGGWPKEPTKHVWGQDGDLYLLSLIQIKGRQEGGGVAEQVGRRAGGRAGANPSSHRTASHLGIRARCR